MHLWNPNWQHKFNLPSLKAQKDSIVETYHSVYAKQDFQAWLCCARNALWKTGSSYTLPNSVLITNPALNVVISWLKTDSSPLGGGTNRTTGALPGTAEISKILAQAQDTGIGQNWARNGPWLTANSVLGSHREIQGKQHVGKACIRFEEGKNS